LSQGRADSKRYPAIDPMDSYSKYLEYPEIESYLNQNIDSEWVARVREGKTIMQRGKEAFEQINILGDDSVPIDYHDRYWKSELIDFVILQQDAFDKIDSNTPIERQKYMYKKVIDICNKSFSFKAFEECSGFYKNLINLFKQMNYAEYQSEQFKQYDSQIEALVAERQTK
jgi:V/A-type H+-transporting ATPase subunit A